MMGNRRPSRRSRSTLLPVRPSQGRLVGGVCTAVADELTIDVTLVRLVFILMAFAWGLGLVIYGLLWLLMASSDDRSNRTTRQRLAGMRGDLGSSVKRLSRAWGSSGRKSWPLPLDRRWIALLLVVAGFSILLASLGAFSWLTSGRALGLAVLVVGASMLISLRSD
jgi:phage shock protein PspC (stress-responsive transcriptional regulator)